MTRRDAAADGRASTMLFHFDARGRVPKRKTMIQQRGRRLEARTGATLVLVAMLIVVIGGMAAFAIDLARIYSGVNELQTGADAAALAGALRLQRITGTSAAAGVQAFSGRNSAFGSAIALDEDDIEGGIWNPTATAFTPTNWSAANAVRITTRSSPTLAFGRLLSRGRLSASRSGIAWIANQSARDCIKPWGFDLTYLNGIVGNNITGQSGVNTVRTLLTTPRGPYSLTFVASPNISNPRGTPRAAPSTFMALTAGSGRKEYEPAIVGQNCEGHTDYAVDSSETIAPLQGGQGATDVPNLTVQGVELTGLPGNQTCAFKTPDDATCYDPSSLSVAGVTVGAAAATQVAPTTATIKVLMEFKLMCVFRGGPQTASSSLTETCPWLTAAGLPANNYVQGTLVGYPVTSVALTGPGNGLGNAISSAQKLVLVK